MTAITSESELGELTEAASEDPVAPCPDPLGRSALVGLGAFFLLAAFIQAPGSIVDDTKLPVLMTPLAWMESALHLWNQTVASGSVQSETFGYLFPMAPFFEAMHVLHVPVWIGERVWLALLLTVGAWGVIRMAEALGIGKRWARVLGAIAYCVAPIVVDWATISVDLLAVVLLPWMLVPLIVGCRQGSPRRAAAKSGVALALMGGVNATVIISTLPLAAIWFMTRAKGTRRRRLVQWWSLSVVLAFFWWLVPTFLQGKYGYNYLPYTETARETTATGPAFEALRGASNWQNYDDNGAPLVLGGWTLVTSPFAIIGSTLVAALGLAGLMRRIPERLFLVASMSFGVLVIAAGYVGPLGGPLSRAVISLLSGPLAPLRNISKFSPDVSLPLALGLIWLVSTGSLEPVLRPILRRPSRSLGRAMLGLLAVTAVVLAAMPFWQAQLYGTGGFANIPSYWTQAANWLDGHQGRQTALLVPGSLFANYTWGSPQDEPLSMLASTSVTVRSIIPLGSGGNTEMLSTVEAALATGNAQPGLAGYLARSGIGYVVERNDLNLAETRALAPARVHQVLTESPGLVEVASFGPYLPRSQVAEGDLPIYDASSDLHLRPVEIFRVEPRVSEINTYPVTNPVIVSGSSGSLLPLAGTGVLAGRAAVLSDDPRGAQAVARVDSTWAITDGNQRHSVSFGKIDDNVSYLLGANQRLPGSDPTVPLNYVVPKVSDAQTVASPIGAESVSATSYGSNVHSDSPSEGPASAFDGDPSTAWIASGLGMSVGQSVAIRFSSPIRLTAIAISQLSGDPQRPTIERVIVVTDRGSVRRTLPAASSPTWVTVAPGLTRHLTIGIDAVRPPAHPSKPPLGVGISDVTIPGVSFRPAMQLPNDQLSAFSGAARNTAVVSISDPVTNPNLDFTVPATTEPPIPRKFELAKAMSGVITGTAVPNPSAALDGLVSEIAAPSDQQPQISASSSLHDLPRFRAENLVEGSASPWIAGFDDPDPTLTLRWSGTRAVGSISLGLTSEASRPTTLVVSGAGSSREVSVPRDGGLISSRP